MIKKMKRDFTRNTIIGIISIIAYVLSICFRIEAYDINGYQTIMSDTISFASFITCLMFIGLAYLPKQSNSKFMQAAKDLRTSIILMHQILITITIYFSLSIVCICALTFSTGDSNIILTALWIGLFIGGMLEVALMLLELFRIILYLAKKNKSYWFNKE